MVQTYSIGNFVDLHANQLIASGVPKRYWSALYHKVLNEVFDAGTTFELIRIQGDEESNGGNLNLMLITQRDINYQDEQEIYLIDHAWTFRENTARRDLLENENLRKRMCVPLGIDEDLETGVLIDEILKKVWIICNTYSVANAKNIEDRLPIWYVMDEIGMGVVHKSEPNCRIVPFIDYRTQITYSLLFPIEDIQEGRPISRDYAEGILDPVQKAALLLQWQPYNFKEFPINPPLPDADYYLKGHIEETLPDLENCSPCTSKATYKVYTEYSLVKEYLLKGNNDFKFEFVENEDEADILWYTHHFKDYHALSQSPHKFVNQFPFEYVITVKDLLSITCRRLSNSLPDWLPVTYNLVTEIGNFVNYFKQREEQGKVNYWIIKPYNLARGLDTHITDNLDYITKLSLTGPKIAQKYIANPVLFNRPECNGKVKFDIRYVVLLSNVNPLKSFVYKNFFLRFANKPFELNDFDDYEKHFTVMNYSRDADLKHMLCSEFKNCWSQQYPDISWDATEKLILKMLKEVLICATKEKPPCGIGESPQSRALYAADIMLEWVDENSVQPKILEINWTPDCKRACEYYPDFYRNIFNLLFLNESCDDFYEL